MKCRTEIASPVAVVTGASRGIGKSIALALQDEGYVVIGCSRSSGVAEVEGQHHFSVDVTDEKAVRNLFRRVGEEYGRLDVLVNNAGVASMNHCLLTPMSTVQKVLMVNVGGTFLCAREAARLMKFRKFGRIINIGSFGVPLRIEGEAIYVASKAAVVSLSQIMAKELAPFGITVNVVGPTAIETDIIKNVPREKLLALNDKLAIKRFGKFADVTNVIKFLISPNSDYVTGQVIYLGGA